MQLSLPARRADNRAVMIFPFEFPLGTSGVLVAAACVVAGGPWFADGYRALRLRRQAARLQARPVSGDMDGLVQARGRVQLAGPLFSPLSGHPCAGFELEVSSVDWPVRGVVHEHRAFDLQDGEAAAHVHAVGGDWRLPVTSERTFAADETLSENLRALLARQGELAWLGERHGAVRIVERALFAGAEVCVIGIASRGLGRHDEAVLELARTGTDGDALVEYIVRGEAGRSCELGPAEALAVQVLGDGPADALGLAPQRRRVLGTLFGPALALTGLIYLARAASSSLAGRF